MARYSDDGAASSSSSGSDIDQESSESPYHKRQAPEANMIKATNDISDISRELDQDLQALEQL